MLDDFYIRALIAGIGVAIVAGPLGCFVVWRRLAYFGDTTAHAALLGVALGLLFGIGPTIGVFATTLAVALALVGLLRLGRIGADSLLGILSHSALSIGLVAIAFMPSVRVDLMGYLFGDVLAVGRGDVVLVLLCAVLAVGVLAAIWRPLVALTVDRDLARAEGMATVRAELAYMLLIAVMVAISMKIVGVLLVTALLIIPAASVRGFSRTPEQMAVLAALAGAVAVVGGLSASLTVDTPAGPSIVVTGFALFLGAALAARLREALRQRGRAAGPAPATPSADG